MERCYLGVIAVFCIALGACAPKSESQGLTAALPEAKTPTQFETLNRYSCGRSSVNLSDWQARGLGPLDPWLEKNGVVRVSAQIDQPHLVQFALEFEKVPQALREKMVAKSSRVRLIQGRGVAEDPEWPAGSVSTFDGRRWSTVPGSGGGVTRIVVNRLYQGHGSINLVLHEYAHSLNSLVSEDFISKSQTWARLWRENPAFVGFIKRSCGSYCVDNADEAFAESVAYYYSCDANRRGIELSYPEMARFLDALPQLDLAHLE